MHQNDECENIRQQSSGKMLQWWKFQYISACTTIISFTSFQPKHIMWNIGLPYEPTVIGGPMLTILFSPYSYVVKANHSAHLVWAWRNYLLRQSECVHTVTGLYMCYVHTVSYNNYFLSSVGIFSISVTIFSGTYGDLQEVEHKVFEEVLINWAKVTAHIDLFICRLTMSSN